MGPKAIQFIQAVARKLLSKRGEGIASIANRMEAESKAGEIAETFRLSGLTPNKWDEFIQSENDVVKYLNIIESSKKPQILRDGNTLGGSKFNRVGEVFDMTGKKLDSSRGIMGGTQIDEKSLKEALMKTDNPFSDLVKTTKKGPKTLAEREAEVLARMNRENKEAVERLKNKKDLDEPEGFYQGGQAQIEPDLSDVGHGSDALMARNRLLTPGSQATTSTGLNYLLGEDNDTTRVPYKNAGPVILPKPKPKPKADPMVELQRIYDLYQEVAPGVAQETQKYLQQDFINKLNDAGISQEQFMTNRMQNNFAEGGRIGYNMGLSVLGFTPEHNAAVFDMDKNFTGSQFDYAAASTKDMVDRASSPLGSVASAIGNVAGRPAYDFVDAAKEYGKKGYQGEFGLSTQGAIDFGKNLGAFGKEFLDQKPGTMMAGALKGGIQSLGTTLGESIYDKLNPTEDEEDEINMKMRHIDKKKQEKIKQQTEIFKEIEAAEVAKAAEASQRQQTTAMAAQNKANNTGGYQSSFGQDTGFMGGSGTAAEMGSFAEGGPARQNFAMGKRAFLKMLGGVGAGIAGIKTGLLGLGKSGGKKVATEVAKEAATSGAPPHFLKLVAKIKALGDDVTETAALADRQTVKRYKDFELTEDIATGRIEIQRVKVADDMDYYGSPITEESYMGYSPGEEIFQETAKGKTKITKAQPKYEEGTTYLRNDGPETGSVLDEMSGLSDDIYEEAGEAVPEAIRKGKADGGRMGYAGGKKVVQGLAALIKGKFGKKAITTADKLKTPQKTLDRDMFSKFKDRNPDPKREITDDEFQDLMEDVGDLDAYNFDGTIGSANKIRKEAKDYQDYMYKQYKMGKLDPVAGDKSPGRKRFLEQKLDDMEGSGDKRLMSPDEIEELSSFDLGTQMDQMKKKTLPEIDDKLLKNYNDEIKRGVAEIMGDTSPEALKKSIEIDNLMLKYPGMDKNLADQIASSSPRMKADMIAMVEQTFKMSEKGMSGDDIIQTFKNTTRRKQATGGLASMLGE